MFKGGRGERETEGRQWGRESAFIVSICTQETQAPSLGPEDPLEIWSYPGVLARKVPWTEEPGGLQSTGVTKSQTRLNDGAHTHICKMEIKMENKNDRDMEIIV